MMKNENKFQIAGLEITPGERWQGTLMIGGGEFVLPAAVLHGEKEGKTVLITAAVHPGEYVGVETAVELANELKMEKITGTIGKRRKRSHRGFPKNGATRGRSVYGTLQCGIRWFL